MRNRFTRRLHLLLPVLITAISILGFVGCNQADTLENSTETLAPTISESNETTTSPVNISEPNVTDIPTIDEPGIPYEIARVLRPDFDLSDAWFELDGVRYYIGDPVSNLLLQLAPSRPREDVLRNMYTLFPSRNPAIPLLTILTGMGTANVRLTFDLYNPTLDIMMDSYTGLISGFEFETVTFSEAALHVMAQSGQSIFEFPQVTFTGGLVLGTPTTKAQLEAALGQHYRTFDRLDAQGFIFLYYESGFVVMLRTSQDEENPTENLYLNNVSLRFSSDTSPFVLVD